MLKNELDQKTATARSWVSSFIFFKKLTELSFIEKFILFGSRARGDNQERADIDLSIVCPAATQKED